MEARHELLGPLPALSLAQMAEAIGDVAQHAEVRKQGKILEHETKLALLRRHPLPRVAVKQDFAVQHHAAGIRLDQIYRALTAFETSLVSLNSRYDRYAHGYHTALSAPEIEGMNVFRSFVARCAECHTPPLFTNQQVAVIGTPEPDGMPRDVGAEKTFNAPPLRGGFKVPTLRNIGRTAPYMHSGRFATLREAVAFYTGGRGHAVPAGEQLQLHWHIWDPKLTDHELDRLVDFLQTLTDESFTPEVPLRVPSGLAPISDPVGRITTTDNNDRPSGEPS